MRVVLVGVGAVGRRTARQLSATAGLDDLVLVDTDPARAAAVAEALGEPARVAAWSPELMVGADVLIVAAPGDPLAWVEPALARRVHVVCVTDSLPGVKALLAVDAEARERDVAVVVGAGFVPGFSCLLARHAAAGLDTVDEIHVAKLGTGGPACARGHHAALARAALDWRNGAWVPRAGGSGRELCWFPDPVGGRDCYRAALPDSLLLQPAFPGVAKVTSRVAATRRDRMSAPLPMLVRPHAEGEVGALRVEVRGRVAGTTEARVLGAIDRPAVAAGAVAAVAAIWAADGRLARSGAAGLAELVDDPVPFLHELAERGVRAAAFEGTSA